ncbi:MAG: hypothetical protein IK079_05550 [Desulfovibrio sp.]|nr:hypothetical protein [Desulfovibrio sp.]
MARSYVLKISKDGRAVSGLYSDFLSGLGDLTTKRASSVEFDEVIQRWVVELKIGPFAKACLIQTFERREDALSAEVAVLSQQHELGQIA